MINNTLLKGIEPYLEKYDLDKEDVSRFLQVGSSDKRKEAIEIVGKLIYQHEKIQLRDSLINLMDIEYELIKLRKSGRDHVAHSVFTYLLGIYLNEEIFDGRVDPTHWKFAALFHDIGYSFELTAKHLFDQVNRLNEIKNSIINSTEIVPSISFSHLESLHNQKNSFDLITKQLQEWGINLDAKKEMDEKIKSGKVCHGMISALMFLSTTDAIYQMKNPMREYKAVGHGANFNQYNFDNYVVPASSAIFIHNFEELSRKIKIEQAPLPYLLKLSDSLQDWDRPTCVSHRQEERQGHQEMHSISSSEEYEIEVNDGKVYFYTKNHEKIKEEIENCLHTEKINILPPRVNREQSNQRR